jgi:hypothetical protein
MGAASCIPGLSTRDPSLRLKSGYAQDDAIGQLATQDANTAPLP